MCSTQPLLFPSLLKKPVVVEFSGGQLSSDAGLLPVAELDQRMRLTAGFPTKPQTLSETSSIPPE